MNERNDQQQEAFDDSIKCQEQLSETLLSGRESFEIWKALCQFDDTTSNKSSMVFEWFNPFVSATMGAHLRLFIINLCAVGLDDMQGCNFHSLRQTLHRAGLLTFEDLSRWGAILSETKRIHENVAMVQNTPLIIERGQTWQLMQHVGLTHEKLDYLISNYFALIEDAARVLKVRIRVPKAVVKSNIRWSIMQIRSALIMFLPHRNDPKYLIR
jgi:hypothetical protein